MIASDRRKYRRVGCHIPSAVRGIPGAGPEPMKAIVSDISEGGIRFTASTPVPVGSEFYVSLGLPHRTVFAKAKPVWTNRSNLVNRYEIGAQFVDLLPDDRHVIGGYVASRL